MLCVHFVFPLLSCFVAKKVSDAENPEFRLLPSFLFGQSMGGAVALKVHLKQPDAWNGAVLAAPMCKVPYLVFLFYELSIHREFPRALS